MIWIAAGSAIVALVLMVLAVFTPRQESPLRFRLYIRAQPGCGWWWEVRDSGEVIVSGCSPYWGRALEEGLAYRAGAEQGYVRQNAPSWQEAAS